jgi:hypothetical protein
MPKAQRPLFLSYLEIRRIGEVTIGACNAWGPCMTVASDWRSPTQGYLHRLNRPGFAWEFLRRNPAYQADYEAIVRRGASDAGSGGAASEALVRRWGLSFRG